jgi:hypothetical protein
MRSGLAQIDRNAVAEATAAGRFGPAALERRVEEVREHYERMCERRADYIAKNAYYYEQVFQLLRFIVPPGKRVVQVGCLTPDFLHVVAPSFGVGIDLCEGRSNSLVGVFRTCGSKFTRTTTPGTSERLTT